MLESRFDLAGCLRLKMVMHESDSDSKSNAPILAFEVFEN